MYKKGCADNSAISYAMLIEDVKVCRPSMLFDSKLRISIGQIYRQGAQDCIADQMSHITGKGDEIRGVS
jgi:hypothetical protein